MHSMLENNKFWINYLQFQENFVLKFRSRDKKKTMVLIKFIYEILHIIKIYTLSLIMLCLALLVNRAATIIQKLLMHNKILLKYAEIVEINNLILII